MNPLDIQKLDKTVNYLKDIDISGKDIYEFGVRLGRSLNYIQTKLNQNGINYNRAFGFDSFIGLPEEKNDPFNQSDWFPGCFDARIVKVDHKYLPKKDWITIEQAIEKCRNNLFDSNKTILISGWFKDVLNKEFIKKYNPKKASLIHIDCDVYTSALECLDFMFQFDLVGAGTIISYDDWGGYYEKSKEFEMGESRAHKEIEKKYNVDFQLLSKVTGDARHGKISYEAAIFKVNSYVIPK